MMSNILGENGSLDSFLQFISPLLNMCYRILSVEVFGMPVWTILLNMLLVFFVIGFITKGSVGINVSSASAADRKVRSFKEKHSMRKGE